MNNFSILSLMDYMHYLRTNALRGLTSEAKQALLRAQYPVKPVRRETLFNVSFFPIYHDENNKLVFPHTPKKTVKLYKKKYRLTLPRGESHFFTSLKKMWEFIKQFRRAAVKGSFAFDPSSKAYALMSKDGGRTAELFKKWFGFDIYQCGLPRTASMTVTSMRTGCSIFVPVVPGYVQ